MKSFVINLDRAPERMTWMAGQFQSLGIPYERVQAVDGKALTNEELQRHSTIRVDGIQWAASEIGCLLSHRECWSRISRGTDDYAVVFEDDLYLSHEVGLLLSTDTWVPRNLDLIKLEASIPAMYQDNIDKFDGCHYIILTDIPWNGTGCYIISRVLAAKLACISEFSYPVDRFLFDNSLAGREFRGFEIQPGICIQASVAGEEVGSLSSELDEDRRRAAALPRKKGHQSATLILFREISRPFLRARKRILRAYRNIVQRRYRVIFPQGVVGGNAAD